MYLQMKDWTCVKNKSTNLLYARPFDSPRVQSKPRLTNHCINNDDGDLLDPVDVLFSFL